jgi:hypothetical protein
MAGSREQQEADTQDPLIIKFVLLYVYDSRQQTADSSEQKTGNRQQTAEIREQRADSRQMASSREQRETDSR